MGPYLLACFPSPYLCSGGMGALAQRGAVPYNLTSGCMNPLFESQWWYAMHQVLMVAPEPTLAYADDYFAL